MTLFSRGLPALFLASIVISGFAALPLWPGRPPGHEPDLPEEKDTTKESDNAVAGRRLIRLGNVSTPTMTVFPAPAEKATGAAILVCPGGGYTILAWDLEGTEVCERLNEMGVTAILLKYRVPKRPGQERHIAPLQDAQRALGLIRQRAAEWKIDPNRLGILGFSAGGHLAAAASNQYVERSYPRIDSADDMSARPDFAVLVYPAYLTLNNEGLELAPEMAVTARTPQTFIVITQDDPVRVENALVYSSALQTHKVPFELHIYPTGGHGYGLRKTDLPVTRWADRLEEWLAARGLLKK